MAQSKTVSLKNLTVLGIEHLPAGGGFMILPGQLGCLDLPRLEELLRGRKVVYLVEDGAALHPQVREHLDKENVSALGIVPSATDAGAYSSAVQAAAADGALIVHVPAEAASIVAPATTVPGVKLDFLLKAGVPVVPLHVLHPREVALPVGAPHDAGESVFAFGAGLHARRLSGVALRTCRAVLLTSAGAGREPGTGLDPRFQKARRAVPRH